MSTELDDVQNDEDLAAALELELHYVNVSFALSCVVLAFCVIGAITNFISIVIYSHPAMRSSINVLLTGLSVIDMFLCICAVPTFVLPPMCLYISYLNGFSPDNILCWTTKYSTLYIYPLTTMSQSCSVWTFVGEYSAVRTWNGTACTRTHFLFSDHLRTLDRRLPPVPSPLGLNRSLIACIRRRLHFGSGLQLHQIFRAHAPVPEGGFDHPERER